MQQNPLGLNGIEFVEFSAAIPAHLHETLLDFGFSKIAKHNKKNVDLYRQGGINVLLNSAAGSFGDQFQAEHGPSISSMGWRVKDAEKALSEAVKRGAKVSVSELTKLYPDTDERRAVYQKELLSNSPSKSK